MGRRSLERLEPASVLEDARLAQVTFPDRLDDEDVAEARAAHLPCVAAERADIGRARPFAPTPRAVHRRPRRQLRIEQLWPACGRLAAEGAARASADAAAADEDRPLVARLGEPVDLHPPAILAVRERDDAASALTRPSDQRPVRATPSSPRWLTILSPARRLALSRQSPRARLQSGKWDTRHEDRSGMSGPLRASGSRRGLRNSLRR